MMEEGEKIIRIDINDEMKSAYIDYSMSVIVARALPDVRDGFKPVHRRILFGMNELGNTSDKPHKKSARIVGEVLGKYHPHGDSSVYFAMIRMAQDWIMRYTLVDGQGNLGSMDGDSPAAMRYTEARLSKMGEEMLKDIEKDTVDFQFNFDDTLQEPSVLPARIPNLLVNGCSGIAVGMATNMPTHNLSEVVDGCIAYIDNNDIDTAGLMKYIKAPDFPTGAYIYGISGVKEAYETGKGRVVMRAKAEIDTSGTHEKIIVREIPYAVNKAELIKSIADMVTDKRLDGISNINDESTEREGVRIVIDIKKDANSNVVLNTLYKETPLQSSFVVNNTALVKARPCQLSLKKLIELFIEHRHDVIVRRTAFELKEAEKRAHLLLGLIIASDNIDEVVRIIRSSQTPDEAIESLMNRFELDKVQARFIVEMRLRQLTATAQRDLRSEYEELMKTIEHLKEILGSKELQMQIIKEELLEIKEKYGDKRKSEIMYSAEDFDPEDFYANEEMVVTISHLGYIKRTPLTEYRVQKRGGLGSKGSVTREEDFIEYIYSAFMHSTMLFFTQNGHCYWLKVYDIPEGGKNSKGRAIQNILNIESGDKVNTCLAINQLQEEAFNTSHFLVFCTKNGIIKKTSLSSYAKPRANGIIALKLREEDQLINVLLTDGKQEIIIANRNGYAIRFNEDKVRDMGKNSIGVNAIKLDKEDDQDEVVGMITISDVEKETILVLSEEGYGKRSDIEDYRMTNRAGKGVRTINITEKTGKLIAIQSVREEDNLMIINQSGITIRMKVSDVRVMGRNTQGVKLINLDKNGDTIAAVCVVNAEEEEDIPTLDLDTTQQENNTTGNNQ